MARPKMPWRPRASSLGYYWHCDYRALLDRMVAMGEIEAVEDEGPKPYADLGTCIHFTAQDGMRCIFPGDPSDHAYTDEQLKCAATLFGRSKKQALQQIQLAALRTARAMPKLADGVHWHAELELEMADLQGHLDFLSDDGEWLVDLKTTTRPPKGKTIKREHLVQLYGYRLMVEKMYGEIPKKGMVLYVDSMKSQWHLGPTFDFHDEDALEFAGYVKKYLRHLRSKSLERVAIPRISEKCSDMFCPYRHLCHDAYTPAKGNYDSDDVVDDLPRSKGVTSLKELANG